jgi:hypothetical protein
MANKPAYTIEDRLILLNHRRIHSNLTIWLEVLKYIRTIITQHSRLWSGIMITTKYQTVPIYKLGILNGWDEQPL